MGNGEQRREFMYVDDLANAVLFSMENIDAEDLYKNNLVHLNIGVGHDVSIKELAELIKEITGFKGLINYDDEGLVGMERKLVDPTRIESLGWKAKVEIKEGLQLTFRWFTDHLKESIVK